MLKHFFAVVLVSLTTASASGPENVVEKPAQSIRQVQIPENKENKMPRDKWPGHQLFDQWLEDKTHQQEFMTWIDAAKCLQEPFTGLRAQQDFATKFCKNIDTLRAKIHQRIFTSHGHDDREELRKILKSASLALSVTVLETMPFNECADELSSCLKPKITTTDTPATVAEKIRLSREQNKEFFWYIAFYYGYRDLLKTHRQITTTAFIAYRVLYQQDLYAHRALKTKKPRVQDTLQELKTLEPFCFPDRNNFKVMYGDFIKFASEAKDEMTTSFNTVNRPRRHRNLLITNLARKTLAGPKYNSSGLSCLMSDTNRIIALNEYLDMSYDTRCPIFKPSDAPKIIAQINKLREIIQEEKGGKASLGDIYAHCGDLIGRSPLDLLSRDLRFFLLGGDTKTALEYYEVWGPLAKLPSPLKEITDAHFGVLRGDPTLLNALYEEAKRLQQAKRKRRAAKIRARQQAAAAEAAKDAGPAPTRRVPLEPSAPTTAAAEPTSIARTAQEIRQASSATRQEILEGEQKRQAKKKKKRKPKKPPQQRTQATQESEFDEGDGKRSLGDFVQLSTTPKDVDAEIRDGTWRFTRDDFILYVQNLGFSVVAGGKHLKAAMPETLFIEHEGKMVAAVLTEFGVDIGSLTLPRWADSPLPYLRGQITNALGKLRTLLMQVKEQAVPAAPADR